MEPVYRWVGLRWMCSARIAQAPFFLAFVALSSSLSGCLLRAPGKDTCSYLSSCSLISARFHRDSWSCSIVLSLPSSLFSPISVCVALDTCPCSEFCYHLSSRSLTSSVSPHCLSCSRLLTTSPFRLCLSSALFVSAMSAPSHRLNCLFLLPNSRATVAADGEVGGDAAPLNVENRGHQSAYGAPGWQTYYHSQTYVIGSFGFLERLQQIVYCVLDSLCTIWDSRRECYVRRVGRATL